MLCSMCAVLQPSLLPFSRAGYRFPNDRRRWRWLFRVEASVGPFSLQRSSIGCVHSSRCLTLVVLDSKCGDVGRNIQLRCWRVMAEKRWVVAIDTELVDWKQLNKRKAWCWNIYYGAFSNIAFVFFMVSNMSNNKKGKAQAMLSLHTKWTRYGSIAYPSASSTGTLSFAST